MQKACFKCGVVKPLNEFYKHGMMSDGHLNKCKECTKRDVKKRYDTQTDTIREYEKKRFQQPERKAKVAEYQRKRRAQNILKYHANSAITDAVRRGRLTPLPCNICGKEKTEAHHTDYTKPLDVTWLCRRHHLEAHGKKCYTDTGEVK